MNRCVWVVVWCWLLCLGSVAGWAQTAREKVIIDTDIGDDVDDAFALALAVKSPEFQILGVTTTFRETELRAKIVDRFLGEVGRTEIPVRRDAAATTPDVSGGKRWTFTKTRTGGGLSTRPDSEASRRDHADCDRSADECGRGD